LQFAAGAVKLRYLAKADAQFTSDGSKLLVMVTGDSSVPVSRALATSLVGPAQRMPPTQHHAFPQAASKACLS
jgi:hypothetical protein